VHRLQLNQGENTLSLHDAFKMLGFVAEKLLLPNKRSGVMNGLLLSLSSGHMKTLKSLPDRKIRSGL
jgi:hypothetical protein